MSTDHTEPIGAERVRAALDALVVASSEFNRLFRAFDGTSANRYGSMSLPILGAFEFARTAIQQHDN